jgi:hypothetical protein
MKRALNIGRRFCLRLAFSMHLQAVSPQTTPHTLIRDPRTLTQVEVRSLVEASKAAMAGKTFRLAGLPNSGGPRMEALMDDQGRPRYLRVFVDKDRIVFEDYTGLPAISCDGKPLDDELVRNYRLEADGHWSVEASPRSAHHTMPRYFDVLASNPESGPLETIDGRLARALVAPQRMGESFPSAVQIQQFLWLDVETLLPVRWELRRNGASFDYGLTFDNDPSLHLAPPDSRWVPTCVVYR